MKMFLVEISTQVNEILFRSHSLLMNNTTFEIFSTTTKTKNTIYRTY